MNCQARPLRIWLGIGLFAWLLIGCSPASSVSPSRPALDDVPVAWLTRPPTPPVTPGASPTVSMLIETAASATAVANTPPATPTTSPHCNQLGKIETGAITSAIAGTLSYRLYLPPCYDQDGRTYPTLIMLGGNIHDESVWDELGLDETADTLIQAGDIPPLIIVMPAGGWTASNTSGGPGSYETVILEELRPFLLDTTCASADAAHWAIGGLSRGGYWALEIAFRFPELFASVGGHSAALLDQYAGPGVNPQSTAFSRDLGNLRIYLDIGDEDYVRVNTIRLHEEMTAAGIDHTWVLQNGRHEAAYWQSHTEDYLRWYTAAWPQERAQYIPCLP